MKISVVGQLRHHALYRRSIVSATLALWLLVMTASPTAASVLYSQLDTPVGGTISMVVTDFPTFTSQGADDFIVPLGETWRIQQVFADGGFSDSGVGTVNTANVFIYGNSSDLPGTLLFSDLGVAATQTGDGDLTLQTDVTLGPGTYWVSVQAIKPFFPDGSNWIWNRKEPQTNANGAWQNPGDGFGTGATSWTPLPDVSFITSDSTDFNFELRGKVVPEPGTIVIWSLLGLAGVGYWYRRKA